MFRHLMRVITRLAQNSFGAAAVAAADIDSRGEVKNLKDEIYDMDGLIIEDLEACIECIDDKNLHRLKLVLASDSKFHVDEYTEARPV